MNSGFIKEDLEGLKETYIKSLHCGCENMQTSHENLRTRTNAWKKKKLAKNKHCGSHHQPTWAARASILLTLHTVGCGGSQRDVFGMRRFHHDVLWQHNYALKLTSHGSPNHISCSSESRIPAAALELRGGAEEGCGELWRGGWSSEPEAKRMECNSSGLETRRRGDWIGMSEERQWFFTLHQHQIKGTGKKSRSEGTEGQGWQKSAVSKRGEC